MRWDSEREEYPVEFLAWFEEFYDTIDKYTEPDEYMVRRFFAYRGWAAALSWLDGAERGRPGK